MTETTFTYCADHEALIAELDNRKHYTAMKAADWLPETNLGKFTPAERKFLRKSTKACFSNRVASTAVIVGEVSGPCVVFHIPRKHTEGTKMPTPSELATAEKLLQHEGRDSASAA